MGHRRPPSAGRTTRQGDRKQRKIREVLVEHSCYLVDGPGATIAAIDDTMPDSDADSNEERARTSRFHGRCEEAEPTKVAGPHLVPWSRPTASLSWALSAVVTIVALGLVAHRVQAGAGRFRREGGHDARGNRSHTAYAVMGRPRE